MKTTIQTYNKVVESFTYLEKELVRLRLNKTEAILNFQILLNERKYNIIERPHFTFEIEDFPKYIRFFKHYNFLDSGFNRNTFRLSKNWRDKAVRYTIPLELEDELLQAAENLQELNNYLHISE